MNNVKTKKGFTLIELLIVIAIIGILAVAFLPSLLSAPAKGRDTARIADLQKIQKVLVNANLEGKPYPVADGSIVDALAYAGYGGNNNWAELKPAFGGALPKNPSEGKNYYFVSAVSAPGYSFGLWSEVEILTNGNANCDTNTTVITPGTPVVPAGNNVPCYAILTQ